VFNCTTDVASIRVMNQAGAIEDRDSAWFASYRVRSLTIRRFPPDY